MRVRKDSYENSVKNDTQYSLYNLSNQLVYQASTDKKAYLYYLFGKVAAKDINGEVYFCITDHLGSVVMMTDEAGQQVFADTLSPFGVSEGRTGTLTDEYAMFTGKDFDADLGLYYFNARWYDPSLGRFITEDPIKDGVNWYVYVGNNPLMFVDPTGLYELESPAQRVYNHWFDGMLSGFMNAEAPWSPWYKSYKVGNGLKVSAEPRTTPQKAEKKLEISSLIWYL